MPLSASLLAELLGNTQTAILNVFFCTPCRGSVGAVGLRERAGEREKRRGGERKKTWGERGGEELEPRGLGQQIEAFFSFCAAPFLGKESARAKGE